METFNFNISLSVLNHLGRNLYRNFITVIGEAISNSWDADASNVWINIDKDNKFMSIVDDGIGMSSDDFQNKFLKIGYSKRKNNIFNSEGGRPFIGRKGIGKLALLSCAKKIHIATKKEGLNPIGGVIDNSELDQAITDDLIAQDYKLSPVRESCTQLLNSLNSGTAICFESITDEIVNTLDYIKKAIALNFKFSLIDSNFNIYVNDEMITAKKLKDLAEKTEYVWVINEFTDSYLQNKISGIDPKKIVEIKSELPIKGYIATTEKPADIKIRGTNEKVSLDLFVNGRLREKDLLKHISTARIVENYSYGQIHCDYLDEGDSKDIFTSSREGIIANEKSFQSIVSEITSIYRRIIEEWDKFRRENNSDGDPDNMSISPKERKAQELFNQAYKEMNIKPSKAKKSKNKDTTNPVQKWVNELSKEALFNIPSYTECFISENLLRKYIEYTCMELSQEAKDEASKWKTKENNNKNAANISYLVRKSSDDLYYLDMTALANFVDKVQQGQKIAGLSRSAIIYKPLRDSVGHTSLLTDIAKTQLNIEYQNIQARLVQLLSELELKDGTNE